MSSSLLSRNSLGSFSRKKRSLSEDLDDPPDAPIDRPAPLITPANMPKAERTLPRLVRQGSSMASYALTEGAVEPSLWLGSTIQSSVAKFRKRGWLFDHKSLAMRSWDRLLWVGAVYSIIYIPMHLVFPELRLLNPNWMHIDVLLDALFTVDVFVKIRTTYVDHGYNIANPRKIALRYLKSWFVIDFFSSLPFDWMLELAQIPGANGIQCASALEPPSPTDSWCAGQLVKLLALLRVGRLIRASDGGEERRRSLLMRLSWAGGARLLKLVLTVRLLAGRLR